MLTPSTAYQFRNASGIQDTVYVLHLQSPISQYFSTQTIPGLTSSTYLDDRPVHAPASLTPLAGSTSIGSVSLTLLDFAGVITAIRQAYPMRGAQATLYVGYLGMTWTDPDTDTNSDFIQVLRGTITQFKRNSETTGFDIEISDRFYSLSQSVFAASDLAAEPNPDSPAVPAPDKSFDSGSLVLSDEDEDGVYDTATMTGTPVGLFLRLALSAGNMSPTPSIYDVWPAWAGLGLTESEVDVDWCETEEAKVVTINLSIALTDAQDGKSLIEDEFCKAFGGYLLLSGQGKIRIRYPSVPTPIEALQTLDDGVLTAKPQWADSSDLFVTHVDYTIMDGAGNELPLPRRASPQWLDGKYDEQRTVQITSRGLQSTDGGISVADAVTDALFSRYGDPPPRVHCQALFRSHMAEPGDVVSMTSDFYPDVDARGQGAERLLEVLAVKAGPFKVDIEAIDLTAPLTAGLRGVIGPASLADYTSATATEKATYAWLADEADRELSNGDPAYIWS